MIKKLFDNPFRLLSAVGSFFLLVLLIVNVITGFGYKDCIYPYGRIVSIACESVGLVLCCMSFFLDSRHYLYYGAIELLVFQNLYTGNVYTSLFLSSILLVLLLAERSVIKVKNIAVYSLLEVVKIFIIVPYGITEFFYYIGLSLFALCTIGCINLLFRHAYAQKDNSNINLEEYKLSDRQKECIKEVVLHNTTIKELALTHNVSESAIKKDLAKSYKVLGITGKADLKALFIDHKFD